MTKHSQNHAWNGTHQEDAVEPSRFGIGLLIGLLSGAIFGGLTGAGTMLFLAPQSGKRTRAKLQRQSAKLRNQATENIEDVLADVTDKAHEYTDALQKGVGRVERRGQAILDEQRDNLAAIVKSGKNAVQGGRS